MAKLKKHFAEGEVLNVYTHSKILSARLRKMDHSHFKDGKKSLSLGILALEKTEVNDPFYATYQHNYSL